MLNLMYMYIATIQPVENTHNFSFWYILLKMSSVTSIHHIYQIVIKHHNMQLFTGLKIFSGEGTESPLHVHFQNFKLIIIYV